MRTGPGSIGDADGDFFKIAGNRIPSGVSILKTSFSIQPPGADFRVVPISRSPVSSWPSVPDAFGLGRTVRRGGVLLSLCRINKNRPSGLGIAVFQPPRPPVSFFNTGGDPPAADKSAK